MYKAQFALDMLHTDYRVYVVAHALPMILSEALQARANLVVLE